MKDYKGLNVWEKSHALTLDIYNITKNFLNDEKFGLTSQIRRAVSSIPTNIAEGYGQLTTVNFIRYLGISKGSAFEVEYLLRLVKDLGYLDINEYYKLNSLNTEIKKMLNSLIKSLQNK